MKKLYIIKMGKTFENIIVKYGDFEDWILDFVENFTTEVIDVQKGDKLPDTEKCAGVIITGSPSMVTQEETWSLKVEKFIKELVKVEVPLLGICYGHQLLAKSLGAKAGYKPKGMEIGTVGVSCSYEAVNDVLFKQLPKSFDVHVVHSQSALSLPNNSVLLASNKFEQNHAFRVGSCAWGVQFHPEYTQDIMKVYIDEISKENKIDATEIKSQVKETTFANKIIKLFVNTLKNE